MATVWEIAAALVCHMFLLCLIHRAALSLPRDVCDFDCLLILFTQIW